MRLRVGDLLAARKITQKYLADRTKVGRPTISKLLKGHRGVRLNDLDAIAETLGVPVAELLRAPEDPIYELNPIEATLVRRFRSVSPAQRDAVLTLLHPEPRHGLRFASASASDRRSVRS